MLPTHQPATNNHLKFTVHCTRTCGITHLIKEHDGCVAHQRAGDGNALLLATRHLALAALADVSFQSGIKLGHKVGSRGCD